MPLTKVSSGVIAANAVVDSFGTQSITGDKLGLTAINANNIVSGAVTGDKLGATSINANNIVNASITASQLATSLNLATNNVQVSSIQSATGTPAITFAANGQMTLANTPLQLTGGQIKFPSTQIPSADANTLDDYEEGTFTPSFSSTGASFTYDPDYRAGRYTKNGNIVTFSLWCATDGSAPTGTLSNSLTISGLPFTAGGNSQANAFAFAIGQMYNVVWTASKQQGSAFVEQNNNVVRLFWEQDNVISATWIASNLKAGTYLLISGSYQV